MKRVSYSDNRQTGFTLVELILVISLLSILAVIGLPKFFEPSSFKIKAAQDLTINTLRYAQKLANATNCQTQFQSAENGQWIKIMMQQTCNQGDFTRTVYNPGTLEPHFSIYLQGLSLVMTPNGPITFFPEGYILTSDRSPPVLSIAGKSFTISPQTGFIHAQ
ncbi:MAG TPA: hypothetical protein DCR13_04840 [Gammaproteobacteria bacterium]|nr:hypothetical protein [Gammaproteobacteria bacterium]